MRVDEYKTTNVNTTGTTSAFLKIGNMDITPYIAKEGFSWKREDIDGPGAGRTLDNGNLRRDRLTTKYRIDITCRPLKTHEASTVLKAIKPEWVQVTYLDPEEGDFVTRKMYSNNIPAQFKLKRRDGDILWVGITFPLIME